MLKYQDGKGYFTGCDKPGLAKEQAVYHRASGGLLATAEGSTAAGLPRTRETPSQGPTSPFAVRQKW